MRTTLDLPDNLVKEAMNWKQIIDYQYKCLKNGLNGVGITEPVT